MSNSNSFFHVYHDDSFVAYVVVRVSGLTIIALAVMAFGAIFAGANDLQFNSVGYFWMVMNCLCTSLYTLYMRYASSSINIPRF